MVRKMLVTLALAVATGALAPQAFAAPSATLDGEQLAHVTAPDVQARCDYGYLRAALSYQGSGAATGPYAGTFTAHGTALLYMSAAPSLFALDATFEIATPARTTKRGRSSASTAAARGRAAATRPPGTRRFRRAASSTRRHSPTGRSTRASSSSRSRTTPRVPVSP